jgi:hypothetical protein
MPRTVKPKPKEAPNPTGLGDAVLSAVAAGQLLMLTPERLGQLAREGRITKDGRDRYPLVPLVQGYITFLKDEERRSSRSAAATRTSDARAREIELRIARTENQLIDFEEHTAVLDELVGMFTVALAGLPAQVTRDLELRRKIEAACHDLRDRLAARAAERSAELRAGGSVAQTDAEDDA